MFEVIHVHFKDKKFSQELSLYTPIRNRRKGEEKRGEKKVIKEKMVRGDGEGRTEKGMNEIQGKRGRNGREERKG